MKDELKNVLQYINNMLQMLSIELDLYWTQNIPLRLKGTSGYKQPQSWEHIHAIYLCLVRVKGVSHDVWRIYPLWCSVVALDFRSTLQGPVQGNVHIKPSEEI